MKESLKIYSPRETSLRASKLREIELKYNYHCKNVVLISFHNILVFKIYKYISFL